MPPRTVEIQEHALDQIRYIRQTMGRTAEFTAVPGWGGVAMGCSALVAAALAAYQQNGKAWLAVWIVECVMGILIGGYAVWRKVKTAESLYSAPARKFLVSFVPPIFAGALLTYVLYQAQLLSLIPGVWLLLYGCAVLGVGTFSVNVVPVMGFCFMVLGVVALFAPAFWGNILLGVGFGVLQICFGVWIAKRFGG